MFSFQHIVCSKNNLSTTESQGQVEVLSLSLKVSSFTCSWLNAATFPPWQTRLQCSTIDFSFFVPVSNEEHFPTELTLLFGYVPDEKKIFFQRNKAMKVSFSDISSRWTSTSSDFPKPMKFGRSISELKKLIYFSSWKNSVRNSQYGPWTRLIRGIITRLTTVRHMVWNVSKTHAPRALGSCELVKTHGSLNLSLREKRW